MSTPIRWGILGLGKIAHKFADDLRQLPDAQLVAVASSSLERAQAFAQAYGAPLAFDRYEALAQCADVDVVYIATPHHQHCACTLLCLENGRAVLCEKPSALHAADTRRMVETARQQGLFFMEALWTCFIPAVEQALEWVNHGAIGHLHTVKADFGFKMPLDPQHRIFNKTLGGGSLLDIGIYPALLGLLAFGPPAPADIRAIGHLGPTGVDESCAFLFRYPDNRMLMGHSTVAATTPIEAWLYGTEGSIYLHPRWHHTQRLTLTRYEGRQSHAQVVDMPYTGWGYGYEAAHVTRCLQAGLLESPRCPHTLTVALSETLEQIGQLIGLQYEGGGI